MPIVNRYRHVLTGTQAAADRNIATPVSAVSCDEEVMVMVAPKKDYYLTRREAQTVNLMSPIQETCQSTSTERL